jgi:predicted nucleotide-binding protein
VERIDPGLMGQLRRRLELSERQVYRRIEELVNTFHLERRPAALLLASQEGLNTARFSTPQDRAAIREALRGAAPPPPSPEPTYGVVRMGDSPRREGGGTAVSLNDQARTPVPESRPRRVRRARGRSGRGGNQGRGSARIWLVHGRNTRIAGELRKLLRALGLDPQEFTQAIGGTRQGSPYVGTVLDRGIGTAGAVVVLLTPDDEARLRAPYRTATDGSHERELTPQPRLNVIWEGGMAFGRDPRRAVLVQVGNVRPFSNITGRHVVHLTGTPASRQELAVKLRGAGCPVRTTGTDWLSEGDFSEPVPRRTRRRRARKSPRGRTRRRKR